MCHETNMQAVQKCYEANELSYKKEKDGIELWGIPKKRIHSGRRVTQDVSFEAFKKIKDQKEILALLHRFGSPCRSHMLYQSWIFKIHDWNS